MRWFHELNFRNTHSNCIQIYSSIQEYPRFLILSVRPNLVSCLFDQWRHGITQQLLMDVCCSLPVSLTADTSQRPTAESASQLEKEWYFRLAFLAKGQLYSSWICSGKGFSGSVRTDIWTWTWKMILVCWLDQLAHIWYNVWIYIWIICKWYIYR